MIPLDERRLQPGSPTARAVYDLMTGARMVRLDCDPDHRLDNALGVAGHLLRSGTRRIVFVVNSKQQAVALAAAVVPALPTSDGPFVVASAAGVSLGHGIVANTMRFRGVPDSAAAVQFVSGLPRTYRLNRATMPAAPLIVVGLDDRPWKGLAGSMSWTEADDARHAGQPQRACPFGRQVLVVGPHHDWHNQLSKLIAPPGKVSYLRDGPWGPIPTEVILAGAPR